MIIAGTMHGARLYQELTWLGRPLSHGFGTRDRVVEDYLDDDDLVIPITQQVHGITVARVSRPLPVGTILADAFVTDHVGVVCAVRTADCVPILLFEPVRRVVAAVHAGWHGLAAGIIEATVATMVQTYGAVPQRLHAAIGPAIQPEAYEVDRPVREAFRRAGYDLRRAGRPSRRGHWRLDLPGLAEQALHRAGVPIIQIANARLSTSHRPGDFASYRRDGRGGGRQVSFICLSGG